MPPVLVIHGTLLDYRLMNLRLPGDAMVMARLALRRDLLRLLSVPGVRWIGSRELIDRLRRHARIEVDHDRPHLAPDTDALFWGAG
jgi:hypothetical protein